MNRTATPAQEARQSDPAQAAARDFLANFPLLDGHNDLPFVIWSHAKAKGDVAAWDASASHPETDTDIPRLLQGQVSTQIFTAFIPTWTKNPIRARLAVIGVMQQLEALYPDVFMPVLAPEDVGKAKAMGRIGLIKAVEGLVGIDDLAALRAFYGMGIRLITLCHNETLPFIDSATDRPGPEPLSDFGRELIGEMERLGLIIDLAHASPAAQHQVMDAAKGPVLISHANARALCSHPRNAPDDVLRRIADRGGMVMATFVPAFLAQPTYDALRPVLDGMGKMPREIDSGVAKRAKEQAFAHFVRDGVQHFCDHLDYMKNLIGAEALGIGSDFYGGPNPPGLEDCSKFPDIFAELLRRRWPIADLERLASGNFLRLWRSVQRDPPPGPAA